VVVTRDVPGLFALIAGTLAAHGVNIISAQIATRADGVAIDTFQVNDPAGEAVTSATQWNRLLDALRLVLVREQTVELLLERRQRAIRAGADGFVRPKISVDNRLSDTDTVVEVKCPDRLGLLYLITRTLSALGLDIASARIATEIDQALDTFYVHDREGRKLDEPAGTERLREAIEAALTQRT
jgi:[protein-PII] uridylyltransferase